MSAHPVKVAAWEDYVLRTIAIFKLAKASLFVALGIGLRQIMHHNVAEMLRVYVIEPMHFDPENRLLRSLLEGASKLTAHGISFMSFGVFFYAAVFATEGIGLYLRKHWAEYMVLISTGALLPVEIYEIFSHLAWWKLGIVSVNLAMLLYLVHRLLLDSRNSSESDEDSDRPDDSAPTPTAGLPTSREDSRAEVLRTGARKVARMDLLVGVLGATTLAAIVVKEIFFDRSK